MCNTLVFKNKYCSKSSLCRNLIMSWSFESGVLELGLEICVRTWRDLMWPDGFGSGVALYLRIFVFSVPDVGAGPHAVVSMVARWLVYPLPAQIFPEVDVQAPHTARLCLAAGEKTEKHLFLKWGVWWDGTRFLGRSCCRRDALDVSQLCAWGSKMNDTLSH